MSDAVTRLNAALEGRYAIERELGEGGMATVYLADDIKHNRKVALKVLKPELAAVVGAERFLAEIQVTANLTHPHILPLFDSGEADRFLFYVMPYVEGESLQERIDREGQLAGAITFDQSIRSLAPAGRMIVVGSLETKPASIMPGLVILKELEIRGSFATTTAELSEAFRLVAEKKIRPMVAKVMPITEVAKAHQMLYERAVTGRLVLRV